MGVVELIKSACGIYPKICLGLRLRKLNREIDKKCPSLSPLARDIISSLLESGSYTRDYWTSIPGIRSSLNEKKNRRFKGLVDYDPEFAKALKELHARKVIILKDNSFSFVELDSDELSDEIIEQIRNQSVTLNTKNREILKIINLRLACD